MNLRRYTVTFTREIEVSVLVPADVDEERVEAVAEELARSGLGAWDAPDWEAYVSGGREVDVPDNECALGMPNQYGYRAPVEGAFAGADVVVLSDDGDDLVSPTDATWWVKSKAAAVVHFAEHGGHRWAMSQHVIVREDCLPADMDEAWCAPVPGWEANLTPAERLCVGFFDPKFGPLLRLGTIYQRAPYQPAVIVRDGEVVAVVAPRRDDGLAVANGVVA